MKWHAIRVAWGARITVTLGGHEYNALDDEHIKGAGAAGVWTKADSVTAFDSFAYGS
jgi:hypothetical protein